MKYQLNLAIALLMGVQSLQAQESCYVDQPYVDTYLYTQEDFGQSFLPCATAELYRMDIPVHNLQVGTFNALLSIYEGEGYLGNLLYTDTVTIGDEWGGFLIHTLSSPLWMQEGQTYTYRLDFNGNYGTMWANFANIYPDGKNFWNGTEQPSIDMGFYMHMYLIETECSTWMGGTSDSWDEPANWDPAGVPDSLDCVIIPAGNTFDLNIPVKANAKDLTVLSDGVMTLAPDAELNVFHTLDVQGQAIFNGEVVMRQAVSGGEILGSPTFDRLKLKGFLLLTEPVTILDVLDVEEGYLANIGTQLILKVNAEDDGHVYMPGANVAGSITFEKTRGGIDGELVGIPFDDLNPDLLSAQNLGQQITGFHVQADPMESQTLWSESLYLDSTMHQGDAVLMRGSQEKVYVSGQANNATVHLLHLEDGESSHDLRSIGNPYPSIVDIEAIERSGGVPSATYRWDAVKRQYSAQVGEASVHTVSRLLRPLDAILVHLPIGEEVVLDYAVSVLRPYEMEEAMETGVIEDHHVRLHIESPSGEDETLIRFVDSATWDWDPSYDAMKIASMDELMPSFGSISQDGEVMAINSIPLLVHGESIPLYLDPGIQGSVQISAPMIDGGACFNTLHLEDRKLGYFHDFMANGSYATDVLMEDQHDRFILHFDRYEAAPVQVSMAVAEAMADGNNQYPVEGYPEQVTSNYDIAVYSGQLTIRPITETYAIPKEALITVYGLGGKLVFQRKLVQSTERFSYQLNVSPGIYYVDLETGTTRERKKVWVD